MNGPRYERAETPEGRLAAAIMSVILGINERNRRAGEHHIIGHMDIEEAIEPFLKREFEFIEAQARLSEVRLMKGHIRSEGDNTDARSRIRNELVAREWVLEEQFVKAEERLRHFK